MLRISCYTSSLYHVEFLQEKKAYIIIIFIFIFFYFKALCPGSGKFTWTAVLFVISLVEQS